MKRSEQLAHYITMGEEKLRRLKQELNTELMREHEASRRWNTSNTQPEVALAMKVLGDSLDKLSFDEQPRRLNLGRSQFKFVSRAVSESGVS